MKYPKESKKREFFKYLVEKNKDKNWFKHRWIYDYACYLRYKVIKLEKEKQGLLKSVLEKK